MCWFLSFIFSGNFNYLIFSLFIVVILALVLKKDCFSMIWVFFCFCFCGFVLKIWRARRWIWTKSVVVLVLGIVRVVEMDLLIEVKWGFCCAIMIPTALMRFFHFLWSAPIRVYFGFLLILFSFVVYVMSVLLNSILSLLSISIDVNLFMWQNRPCDLRTLFTLCCYWIMWLISDQIVSFL